MAKGGMLFRLGAVLAPKAKAAGRRAFAVLDETREAFGRGLRDEPEPPPRLQRPAASAEQLAGWYANLELPAGADLDAVQAAWKRLQRRYHPDLHAADPERAARATRLVQELSVAYRGLVETLSESPGKPRRERAGGRGAA